MKNFRSFMLLILAILFGSVIAYPQEVESLNEQSKKDFYDYHFAKHRKLRKTGFILLGTGLAATITGALVLNNADSWADDANLGTGGLLFTAGTLTTISSIPVFIVSGSHKRKAEGYLQAGITRFQGPESTVVKYPTAGLKIEF